MVAFALKVVMTDHYTELAEPSTCWAYV